MTRTRTHFEKMINQLGPYQCIHLMINTSDDMYDTINNYVNLQEINVGHLVRVTSNKLHCKFAVKRMSYDTYYIEIVKKPDGLLGMY